MADVITAPKPRTVKRIKTIGVKIGEGMYRRVYRTKRGKWVVKVDMHPTAWSGNNKAEWKTYLRLKQIGLPAGVALPEMYMMPNGDIVAQYIKGKHPESSCSDGWHSSECADKETCWSNRFEGWGCSVSDMHTENVIIGDDGIVYIIDLGFGLD